MYSSICFVSFLLISLFVKDVVLSAGKSCVKGWMLEMYRTRFIQNLFVFMLFFFNVVTLTLKIMDDFVANWIFSFHNLN